MTLILDNNKVQEYINDGEYLHSNYNDLIKNHNHEYVAIKNQQVFKHAKTIDELEDILKKENIKLGSILVEFIRDKRGFM